MAGGVLLAGALLVIEATPDLPGSAAIPGPPHPADSTAPCEVVPHPIALSAPLDQASAEVSGLAWHGDTLVVLPQYPSRMAPEGTRRLYGLPREALLQALADTTVAPIAPTPIQLTVNGPRTDSAAHQGFEALAFVGSRAYLLMERARPEGGMDGGLFPGTVSLERQHVTVRAPDARLLPAQAVLRNMSYEALTTVGDTVLALFEANGARVNPDPRAHRFDAGGQPAGTVSFPTLEYRLTDATAADARGRFWVMNYFFPGERGILQPAPDSLAMRFGRGRSHHTTDVVERLVEYQYTPAGIRRTEAPPIQLALDADTGRNWEGLARLNDGFLLATDRFPTTLLAYVPAPHAASCLPDTP